MGLDGLQRYCEHIGVDQTKMHGHLKASKHVRHYLVVCALVAFGAEALSVELFMDDRAMRRLPELRELFQEEFEYVDTLPSYVFRRLREIVDFDDLDITTFRRAVMLAKAIYGGFTYDQFFRSVHETPLQLDAK